MSTHLHPNDTIHFIDPIIFTSQVAFTGSVATGTNIASNCALALRHCSLELGGKSPLLLFADYIDGARPANNEEAKLTAAQLRESRLRQVSVQRVSVLDEKCLNHSASQPIALFIINTGLLPSSHHRTTFFYLFIEIWF